MRSRNGAFVNGGGLHMDGAVAVENVAPKRLRIPHWTQMVQVIVGVLGVPVLLFANKAFRERSFSAVREWLTTLRFSPRPHVAQPQEPLFALHLLQALVIICVIIVQRRQLRLLASRLVTAGPIARQTFQQFRASWMLMWFMWLVLYIWFSIRAFAGAYYWADSVGDVFNVLSGFAIWRCFLVLDMPSVNIQGGQHRDMPFRRAQWIAIIAGICSIVVASADRAFHLGHFGLACVGLYGGLALACLAGRLGSHYIGMPRWMLLFLYLYAMMQLFYSFFDILSPLWTWTVFVSVLVLKVMLAFAGTDMLRYGGLNRYLKAAEFEFRVIAA